MKSPYYKNIMLGKTKEGRIKGLFEIFEKSNLKTLKGFSVKIHHLKISLRRFRNGFYDEFDEEDKDYGDTAWDYINKELAIKHFEGL